MRYLLVATILSVLMSPTMATAVNENATLPLHAVQTLSGSCVIPAPSGPDPCLQGAINVQVEIGSSYTIYLMARNFDGLTGVQMALDWGLWSLLASFFDCFPGQVGSLWRGNLATGFDCVTGGTTTVFGQLILQITTSGCLTILETDYPNGTGILSCTDEFSPVPEANRGLVCAPPEVGYDACNPAATPVEPATWGAIKSQYGPR